MIRTRSFIASAALAAAILLQPAAAADSTTTIHFAHHATEASLTGAVKGYDSANFLVGARAGQEMKVSLKPSNSSCYFNLWPPGQRPDGSGSAIFIGSSEGNEFGGTLSADGSYLIQVYLMRNEARRGTTCKFDLHVSIAAGGSQGNAAAGSAEVSDDAMRADCKGEAAGFYGVRPDYVTLDAGVQPSPEGPGFAIYGSVDKGSEGTKVFTCFFDASRKLQRVMPGDSDGE